jgi:dihydrofolate reductase
LAGAVAKTQYYTAASIDGFIADRDNSLDWLSDAGSGAGKEDRFAGFFAGVGAMGMGARTYEWAVEHESLLEGSRQVAALVRLGAVLGVHSPAAARRSGS